MNGPLPLFEVRDLRVEYPGPRRAKLTAVRGLSLDLWPGRILAIVGESGCGKTSLARAMLGLAPAPPGSLRFLGQDLTALHGARRRSARRGIQHVFQDPAGSLSPRRTIRQALEEPLSLYRIGDRHDRLRRVTAALDTVGLDGDLLSRFPHELSGGQRQRVALARALVAEPALIVADEPLSSLDVSAQAQVVELIRRVREQRGIAFLLISHDLAVVQQLADEVGVMYLGRLVEFGPADVVFRSPSHPYTQALLTAAAGVRGPDGRHAQLGGEPPSPLTPPSGCAFHTRCPRAMERCVRDVPGPVRLEGSVGDSTIHSVRCHLWT